MDRAVRRTTACLFTAFLTTSAAANAHEPLARIHDEQTGTAALVTAFHMVDRLSFEWVILVKLGQLKADSVLQELSTLTTPAALAADRDGIDIACPVSGHYMAQVTAGAPRRLIIEWHDCVNERFGAVHTVNGPARITLLSDSFIAPFVGEIRLGTPSRDLVETVALLLSPDSLPTIQTYNSSVRGLIPMTREPIVGEFVGPFGIHLNGFYDELSFPLDTNGEIRPTGFRITADDVAATGTRLARATQSDTLLDTSTSFADGALTFTLREGDLRETQYQTFDQLRVRDITSIAGAGRVSFELNGNTEFFHNESAGTGCLSGNYRFLTTLPVQLNPGGFETYDVAAGELRVNYSLLARFSESDPRLTMRIGSSTFTSDPSGGALTGLARCFP